MKATLMVLMTVLIFAGLALVVLTTAQGGEDWIELTAIAALAVVLGVAAGGRAGKPRRRVRGFTRTPDSDW